jgi:Rieske Fe-S protein
MNRKEFVKSCSAGCLGVLIGPILFSGCAGTKYVTAPIEGSDIVVPISSFEIIKDNETRYRRYVVVQNDTLQFPICVYRVSAESYTALWMKCTHQGTELHAFGDRLQCPAHGSEFTKDGQVQNGPAADPLRTFPVVVAGNALKINMR